MNSLKIRINYTETVKYWISPLNIWCNWWKFS